MAEFDVIDPRKYSVYSVIFESGTPVSRILEVLPKMHEKNPSFSEISLGFGKTDLMFNHYIPGASALLSLKRLNSKQKFCDGYAIMMIRTGV